MSKPTIVEMIEAVKDKLGENQAFEKLAIDRKTYYNYKNGGNPNKRKARQIEEIYREVSQGNGSTNHIQKENPDESGLMKELLESQRARIKLLEERQQSETRLIQVEATLKIVVEILNGLKIQERSHTPAEVENDVEEVAVRLKSADKSENSGRGAASKSGKS